MTNDFRFKKKFGQNFIKDQNIINKIVDNSNLDYETLVIEVGPGAGILTKSLAKKTKQVLAYEVDLKLKDILTKELDSFDNVDIIYEDFLKRDLQEDIKQYNYKKLCLVANLPYYITTPIITKIIESDLKFEAVVVMVQKEVGERFNAKINTKSYNSLTVFLSYHFDIKKIFDVSRTVFFPIPNVDSSVIMFKPKQNRTKALDENVFYKLVRDSFQFKRKNIKNNLKNYNLDLIKEVLEQNNLDLNCRAENINLETFIQISNKISQKSNRVV